MTTEAAPHAINIGTQRTAEGTRQIVSHCTCGWASPPQGNYAVAMLAGKAHKQEAE